MDSNPHAVVTQPADRIAIALPAPSRDYGCQGHASRGTCELLSDSLVLKLHPHMQQESIRVSQENVELWPVGNNVRLLPNSVPTLNLVFPDAFSDSVDFGTVERRIIAYFISEGKAIFQIIIGIGFVSNSDAMINR